MREATRISNTRTVNSASERYLSRDITRDKGVSQRIVATTIAGDANGTITDSGNGLGVFEANSIIEVRGSASFDGEYVVTAVAAGALTVDPPVPTEAAGASIEIRRK
ncbi:MAG: hypothetical protein V2I24_09380 [Halieaceae bacterium]|jgi:hypothetical protein|nr:hypothetical protein [Halieaceae bacterium]